MTNYLLYGANDLEKKDFLRQLKKDIKGDEESIEVEKIDLSSEQTSLVDLKTKVRTPSLFSKKRLLIVRGLFVKLKEVSKDLAENFFEALADLKKDSQAINLVILEKEVGNKSRLKKIKKADFKVKEFKAPPGYKLAEWLKRRAVQYKLKLPTKTGRYLISRAGSDSQKLDQELKKLRNYLAYDGRRQVSIKDVKVLVSPNPEVVIFDFLDAVAQKNYGAAGGMLEQMLARGVSEVYLTVMIDRTVSQLLMAKDLKKRKPTLSSDGLAKKFGWHPFVAKKITSQISYFNKKDLISIYQNLFDLEVKIKTGQAGGRLQLTRFLAKL